MKHSGYGPSGTTNICTVRQNVMPWDLLRNIGRPFKNTSAFVVSEKKQFSLKLRGAIGEFCFGGDQIVNTLNNWNTWQFSNSFQGSRVPQPSRIDA